PALHDRLKDGLRVGGRRADQPENLSGRSLLLARFFQFAGEGDGVAFWCGRRARLCSAAGPGLGRPRAAVFHRPSVSTAPPHGPPRVFKTRRKLTRSLRFLPWEGRRKGSASARRSTLPRAA